MKKNTNKFQSFITIVLLFDLKSTIIDRTIKITHSVPFSIKIVKTQPLTSLTSFFFILALCVPFPSFFHSTRSPSNGRFFLVFREKKIFFSTALPYYFALCVRSLICMEKEQKNKRNIKNMYVLINNYCIWDFSLWRPFFALILFCTSKKVLFI